MHFWETVLSSSAWILLSHTQKRFWNVIQNLFCVWLSKIQALELRTVSQKCTCKQAICNFIPTIKVLFRETRWRPKKKGLHQWRIQKILVGGDLKHKTSKIRMSSPKLRVIFRPNSEIQTFFSPKFRWSPKKKKKGLHQNWEWFFGRNLWGAVWKKIICFVNHVFWAYLDHNLSDIYIGNIRLIYRTNCALSRTRKHTQNKSDKIVFFQTARHSPFGKKLVCDACFFHLFRQQFVRDIYIGNIRLIYRTNCTLSRTKKHAQNKSDGYFRLIYRTNWALSRTKKHAQNKSDISDLYIGQIVP